MFLVFMFYLCVFYELLLAQDHLNEVSQKSLQSLTREEGAKADAELREYPCFEHWTVI